MFKKLGHEVVEAIGKRIDDLASRLSKRDMELSELIKDVFWLNTPDTSRRDKLFTNRGTNHEPETYLQTVPARI